MPVSGRRFHQKSRGVGRSRMFLADNLGWIPGFPLGQADGSVLWMSIPEERGRPGKLYTLTRESLHDATFTWSKLINRFPHALPDVIKNLSRWHTHLPIVLDWLKGAIHKGETVPADLFSLPNTYHNTVRQQAAQLKESWPVGANLIEAFSWLHVLRPQLAGESLEWLITHRAWLETILLHSKTRQDGIVLICKLRELHRRENGRNLKAFMALVGHPVFWSDHRASQAMYEYLGAWQACLNRISKNRKSRQKKINAPQYPLPPKLPRLNQFTDHLLSLNKATCGRMLNLFELIFEAAPEQLNDWKTWYQQIGQASQKGRQLYHLWQNQAHLDRGMCKEVKTKFKSLKESQPVQLHLDQTLERIHLLSSTKYQKVTDHLIHLFKVSPQFIYGGSFRQTVLVQISERIKWSDLHRIESFLASHAQYSKQMGDQEGAYLLWKEACQYITKKSTKYWDEPSALLVDEESGGRKLYDSLFKIWTEIVIAGHFSPTIQAFNLLIDLHAVGLDKSAILMRIGQLMEANYNRYIWRKVVPLAHKWSKSGKAFVSLVKTFSNKDAFELDQLLQVKSELETAGWNSAGCELVEAGHLQRLITISHLLSPASDLSQLVAPPLAFSPTPEPEWISRFPADFHPALNTLNSFLLTEKALSLADNVLGQTFPDPAAIEAEIEFIKKRLVDEAEHGGLIKRLASLQKRLDSPQQPSAKKVEKLNHKLESTIRSEMLSVWQADLDGAMITTLRKYLKTEDIAPELLTPHGIQLLPPIMQLKQPYRDLGLQLLRNRCGPKPWLFKGAKANLEFTATLKKRGVNIERWLNPPPIHEVEGKNGRKFFLNFEDDPIEILHMGSYFKTCLTPGSFNFYSAVVNAVDINKHVIFGRAESGKVIARCLIGLTAEGGILAFHPYSHDGGLGFKEIMADLVNRLADEMQTVVLGHGQVPSLTTPDWYDDGPVDLSQKFEFLNQKSAFRKELEKIKAENFISTLEQQFNPIPLNGLTLPLVLNLSEVQNRPELIHALLPFVRKHSKSISDQTWFALAKGLYALEKHAEVKKIMSQRAVPYLLQYQHDGWLDFQVLDILIDYEPIAALQVLRKTRPSYIHSDQDEYYNRAKAFIRIYDQLHRPNKRDVLKKKWAKELKKQELSD